MSKIKLLILICGIWVGWHYVFQDETTDLPSPERVDAAVEIQKVDRDSIARNDFVKKLVTAIRSSNKNEETLERLLLAAPHHYDTNPRMIDALGECYAGLETILQLDSSDHRFKDGLHSIVNATQIRCNYFKAALTYCQINKETGKANSHLMLKTSQSCVHL